MKVFLTGGSGFVGNPLLKELIADNCDVYALARSLKSARKVRKLGAKAVEGDLTKIELYKYALRGIDAVIHVGAMIDMWGDYKDFYRANVLGTKELLEVAIKEKVKKFIYISAAAVVAEGRPLIDITEDYRPKREPQDNYSKTKAMAEKIVLSRQDEIQTVVLRPPLIWGKDMPIIKEFRENIEKNGFPTIGNIKHTLATCHVKNLVSAIMKSFHGSASGVFYITDGEKRPLKLFIKELAKAYGLDVGNRSVNRTLALLVASVSEYAWRKLLLDGKPPITKSMVYLMGSEFSIDDSKARRELGYENVISIDEGLKELFESQEQVR